jgi:hypothetical protein
VSIDALRNAVNDLLAGVNLASLDWVKDGEQ